MPVIYVKLRAIFQPNGGRIDFSFTQMGSKISYLSLLRPAVSRVGDFEGFPNSKGAIPDLNTRFQNLKIVVDLQFLLW